METSPATSAASASSTRKKKPTPCCSKIGLKRGPWTPEEDEILAGYIRREGEGKWRTLPKRAGLLRCGKSCRLRWMNYLKPSVKRGHIAADEEDLILRLHRLLGNRWSLIAGRIPGRTDNEIKNYWNTHLSKKLISNGIDPTTHKPLNPRQTLSYVTTPNPSPSSEEKPEAACPPSKNTVGSSAAVAEEGIFASDCYDYNMGFLPEGEFSSLMEPVIAGGGELFRCDGSQMEELQCYGKTYYGSTSGNGLPDYESFVSLWEATDANN